jgi:hypothetical protein
MTLARVRTALSISNPNQCGRLSPLSRVPRNHKLPDMLVRESENQFGSRPDLPEKVMPSDTPGAKRMMRDNGGRADALTSEKTTVATDPIARITPTGVQTRADDNH